ncbi:hypothetical protein BT93_A1151 [Corymbia citriodora subsp. variegata]|nr:hypothetical protein BT93_A1151 [Corymbia citriodora subsp. variegata]KAF8042733.1 hypothetical protein BT93_A1151 [Corymbia citriodora subsp. variegata]
MDPPRKQQVSLRGASVREITRDALLEKVSQDREARSYARRANAAALFIQRVWRRYYVTKMAALQLREEWDTLVNHHSGLMTGTWISCSLLRPFLFFVRCLSVQHQTIQPRNIACMQKCFKILLESIHSTDLRRNFCCLAIGTLEERRTWNYQAQKLITLCSFVLASCDTNCPGSKDMVVLTSLAMRLLVVLTDRNGWKILPQDHIRDIDLAVKNLICFMGSKSGLYISVRKYIMKLDVLLPSQRGGMIQTEDRFLITASALTLALRPFHVIKSQKDGPSLVDIQCAATQYCLSLLTIPWLLQRLPAFLVPALKHKSVLSPCFQPLLMLRGELLSDMSDVHQQGTLCWHKAIPPVGWALANVICLMTGNDNGSLDTPIFCQDVEHGLYVRIVITLAENFLDWIDNGRSFRKENQRCECDCGTFEGSTDFSIFKKESIAGLSERSYVELLRPVYHQSHLTHLLAVLSTDTSAQGAEILASENLDNLGKLQLVHISYFYSYMLRLFSVLNPVAGSLPILNMLSFTPGFLVSLWRSLETNLFHGASDCARDHPGSRKTSTLDVRQQTSKFGGGKWTSVLQIITGKSQASADSGLSDSTDSHISSGLLDEVSFDVWDVELLRSGPQGLSKDMSCLLHLFCATYSHLLLVLDDIEFYEKQVPFKLEEQRNITSALNTLVYNGLSRNSCLQNKPMMESATQCLHLMYERDCRHQFCPPDLWLSPAKKSRPPIAIAARTHDVLSTKSDDLLLVSSMGSIITTMPHVYPFEERVEMFREFIKMDKVSRVMAGEVAGPGSRNIEIVIRRGNIVEDGFRQLNTLGSRLKSSIHVSFVSECGLPEAGLDYGGLSKEFLTDLSKAAFSPEYGLFTQTSTEDRLLMPNISAKYLENGLQMIEFLGRIVGKALYEGILLDYSFSHVFVQKLLGRYSFLDELSTLDPEVYRNLMYVKHFDGDVKELSLDFTITEESFGKNHVIELRPGGRDICVTNENKMQYIHAIADYKLNRQILAFANAFYRGLTDLILPSWLKLFNATEFNQLLSGGYHDIDVDDLRSNTRYTGGYSEGSRTVKLFWEVMKGFEPKERCMLLKFVTSCSRAPLLGFKHLQPTFTIHKVACDVPVWATIGGQDVERLPSASTCYNTLKLPTYKRASTMRSKLLYAISSNTGFELS